MTQYTLCTVDPSRPTPHDTPLGPNLRAYGQLPPRAQVAVMNLDLQKMKRATTYRLRLWGLYAWSDHQAGASGCMLFGLSVGLRHGLADLAARLRPNRRWLNTMVGDLEALGLVRTIRHHGAIVGLHTLRCASRLPDESDSGPATTHPGRLPGTLIAATADVDLWGTYAAVDSFVGSDGVYRGPTSDLAELLGVESRELGARLRALEALSDPDGEPFVSRSGKQQAQTITVARTRTAAPSTERHRGGVETPPSPPTPKPAMAPEPSGHPATAELLRLAAGLGLPDGGSGMQLACDAYASRGDAALLVDAMRLAAEYTPRAWSYVPAVAESLRANPQYRDACRRAWTAGRRVRDVGQSGSSPGSGVVIVPASRARDLDPDPDPTTTPHRDDRSAIPSEPNFGIRSRYPIGSHRVPKSPFL